MGSVLLGHFGSFSLHGFILIAGSSQILPQAFQGALILGTNDAKLRVFFQRVVSHNNEQGH
jgi:hypothetical protein